ncbi:OB-fold putative lipoprotein [Dehalococcoides mccartyi]|uniref:OB-fold putative lipoprotein n=1 Tax=Dehalococcoides mccartyi TaxID=61435 RepID=UPI00242B3085|nr:OB-fold putative lipoprotein [Dehalococcoides mccartyi]
MEKTLNNKLVRALLITSPLIIIALVSVGFSLNESITSLNNEDSSVTAVISQLEPAEVVAPPVQIAARVLYEEYISNQTAADIKYRGSLVVVQGVLSGICPATSTLQWVTLETDGQNAFVKCQLSGDFTFLSSINDLIGQTVTIAGICQGFSGSYLIIDEIYTNDLPTHTDLG